VFQFFAPDSQKIETPFYRPIPQKLKYLFLDWEKAITHEHKRFTRTLKAIMTDAAIIALTNKLTARRKETKNFLKMIEKSDVSSKVEATKEPSKTQNRKGNRLVVRAEYSGPEFYFKIPDGLDLEDKTVVKWWGVFYGELSIHYVDGREEQICPFEEFEGDTKRPHEAEIELVEDCGACENPYEEEDEEETTYYQVVGEWIVLSTEEGIPRGTQEGDAEVFNTIEEARVCFQKWIDEQFDEDEPFENIRIESFKKDECGFAEDYETIECWSQEEDDRFQRYKAYRAEVEHFKARN